MSTSSFISGFDHIAQLLNLSIDSICRFMIKSYFLYRTCSALVDVIVVCSLGSTSPVIWRLCVGLDHTWPIRVRKGGTTPNKSNTVECRYNAVLYSIILHTVLVTDVPNHHKFFHDQLFHGSWWAWRCRQMETFSALLALCAGNSPVLGEFPAQRQWRGALMFSMICAQINGWVNNREAGDLRRYCAHYDLIVMDISCPNTPDKSDCGGCILEICKMSPLISLIILTCLWSIFVASFRNFELR